MIHSGQALFTIASHQRPRKGPIIVLGPMESKSVNNPASLQETQVKNPITHSPNTYSVPPETGGAAGRIACVTDSDMNRHSPSVCRAQCRVFESEQAGYLSPFASSWLFSSGEKPNRQAAR